MIIFLSKMHSKSRFRAVKLAKPSHLHHCPLSHVRNCFGEAQDWVPSLPIMTGVDMLPPLIPLNLSDQNCIQLGLQESMNRSVPG